MWIYGHHAVAAALSNPKRSIKRVVVTGAPEPAVAEAAKQRAVRVEIVKGQELQKLVGADAVHQGIAADVQPLEQPDLSEVLASKLPLVVLDQVTDPHNVGAILRSAAAFGAGAVIVPKDHAPGETATLAKAASGALELVPLVTIGNLSQALEKIKQAGYWVAGFDGTATQTMRDAKLGKQTALVFGAEGAGMRRLTGERCDLLVRLPISEKMESLNVSNAAAVALYELSLA